ncbi:c-type cytochrome [Pseudomonas marginalis]|uniref:Cytochrome c-551 n=2 Tax=Pseudomonas marginalis TaxID=298 RepID=A0A3M4AJ98_PSEMA|nr:c-type cytochrome [Pseudomonas marginalis]OAJ50556.1 cytochrome C [Pseudomonas marginalis]RMP06967.1 hypothetical protein ALQ29_01085 [Pseudomonas marginalis pv. marginalis]
MLVLSLGTLTSALWPTQVVASQALVQRYACVGCHQANAQVVGPSWKGIAQKYAGSDTTTEQLAASIKAGGTGKWGPMPMPPQAQVSDADAKSIAQWLLDGAQ